MRKVVPAVVAMFLVVGGGFYSPTAFGGLLDAVTGGGASGDLKGNVTAFVKYMNVGTVHLTLAAAKMQEAVGQADLAKQLEAQADIIKKAGVDTTDDQYTQIYALIDQANTPDRATLAKVPTDKGQVLLGQSALHMGIGTVVDKNALTIAQKIASAKPSAQDMLSGSVISGIKVAKVAVTVLPSHIQKTASWTGLLGDYFSSHKIAPPSAADEKKVAADDLPPGDADKLFQ